MSTDIHPGQILLNTSEHSTLLKYYYNWNTRTYNNIMIHNCFYSIKAATPLEKKEKEDLSVNLVRLSTSCHPLPVTSPVDFLFSLQRLHTGQFPACPRRANPQVAISLLSGCGRGRDSVALGGCGQGLKGSQPRTLRRSFISLFPLWALIHVAKLYHLY